jgi:hypothetical protein
MAEVVVIAMPTDTLILNDQGFASNRTFTLTETSIDWGTSKVTCFGLGSATIHGGPGGNVYRVRATPVTAAVTIVGGSGRDTLVGSDAGNIFAIDNNNAGTLSSSAYGSKVLFSQVGNLTTGSGGDTFQFADGASLSGMIVGGGRDRLDYSAYRTSVLVDLQTGFATGVGGSVAGIATVVGGSETPSAIGVFNLLIGSGGNMLYGGLGRRNILVAGGSPSTLYGGDREDLLIGGSTAYDAEIGLVSWQLLAAYWAGSDDYATRVTNLMSGTGVPLLDATIVTGNGGSNVFSGHGALALIYTDGLDTINELDSGSLIVKVNP